MRQLFIACLLTLCWVGTSFGQEEALKDSMEVYFKLDRSNLLPESQTAIDEAFAKYEGRIMKVRVAGHTCDWGTDNYNMGLSERRANSAFEYVKTIGDKYQEQTELFFYGEKEQKYDERELNRRVFVLFYLEDDDRDTTITEDCASVMIEKGSFADAKTKESSYTLKYYQNSKDLKMEKIGIEDNQGRKLYFNSIVYFQPTFEGAELMPTKPVKIKLPLVNADREGYMLYEGAVQNGTVVWTNTGKPCQLQTEGNCQTYNFDWQNKGYCACAMPRACADDCNPDAFGGEEAPALTDADVRYSGENIIVKFDEGTYTDLGNVTVVDDNNFEEDLDICEQFEYGITSDDWFPNRHMMTAKKNIIVRSEAAPANKVSRIYIPKSAVSDLKEPVLLIGERHSQGYPKYVDQIVKPAACLGPVNCEYVVFDAPSTGLYKLGEWDAAAAKPKQEEQYILKVRLLKDSEVFVGNKKTGEVYKAVNTERNGKTRVKEYRIYQSDDPSDVVVFVRNSTKPRFKLWQEAKLSDLNYKKASNMYIMRRVKFNKVNDYSEVQLTKCAE